MDKTLGYILCCQSPALFLAAVVLLICYFARRNKHKVRATLDLILAILLAAAGVAMYFMGMRMEFFTIRDFYQLRTSGIVGLIVVAAVSVYTAVRAFLRYSKQRREEKEAIRAENARKNTDIIAAEPQKEAPAVQPVAQPIPEPVINPAPASTAGSTADMAAEAAKDIKLEL